VDLSHSCGVTVDLDAFRFITASAYAGMMAPLTELPSTVGVLSGDTDTSGPTPGVESLSLEGLDGIRRRWRLGDLSRLADYVPKVLSLYPEDHRPAFVVPPRLTTPWEQAAAPWPDGIRLLGRPAREVARIADDKVFVREQVGRLGVSVPRATVVDASSIVDFFPHMADTLGTPFVLQAPLGAGGAGTYLVRTRQQLIDATRRRSQAQLWLVSAYAGDLTVNVTGVIDNGGIGALTASVQSSGIPELGASFGAYCGTDFGRVASLPEAALSTLYEQTAQIGRWLYGMGHCGLFGADFAVSGSRVAFLEVNPRIQGSSWLLSKLERAAGGEGCLIRHVRALLGETLTRDMPALTLAGSHLLVRWTGRDGVVRSVPETRLGRDRDDQEIRITGLPAVGSIITSGAIVARFESTSSLTEPNGTALRPHACALLAALRANLEVDMALDKANSI
jgi:formate-dependent phosphoribosylglycinamide formyltransferase (GAR transformylase)